MYRPKTQGNNTVVMAADMDLVNPMVVCLNSNTSFKKKPDIISFLGKGMTEHVLLKYLNYQRARGGKEAGGGVRCQVTAKYFCSSTVFRCCVLTS